MQVNEKLKKLTGQRLQMLRLEQDLTQEQMGEKLHLSTSAYCKLEYGETELTLTRLAQIAEVLGMSATELFNNIIRTEPDNNIRELIKANSRLIETLCKKIDSLDNK